MTRKYDTLTHLLSCGGEQESADDGSKQINGKKGRLSPHTLCHYKVMRVWEGLNLY